VGDARGRSSVTTGPVAATATAKDQDDEQQDRDDCDDHRDEDPSRCSGFKIGTRVRHELSVFDTECLYQIQNVNVMGVTYN
jgi:hypothetical protein